MPGDESEQGERPESLEEAYAEDMARAREEYDGLEEADLERKVREILEGPEEGAEARALAPWAPPRPPAPLPPRQPLHVGQQRLLVLFSP